MDLERLCPGCMSKKPDDNLECAKCGFVEGTLPDSPLFLPPRTVLENKYLIGRVLGQGGFGITYLAWDLNLNVKLAIKEYFPQELASRAAGHSQVSAYTGSMGSQYDYGLDKFLQEARTLAQFEGHPNIVSVRDFFKANGTAYFVMSYVEGITVKDHLAASGGLLPPDQARHIIVPVMDALKEVHAVGILHRDVSPDNIFINKKGQVILIDFGAARQAIGEKGRSLSIILKPGYAPEEQYRTKGVQGPWTDIYAIAATYYHLLTGKQPPEALERLLEDPLEPPTALGVNLSEEEEGALLKALAVRAEERFQSIQEFLDVLLGITPLSGAGAEGRVAPSSAAASSKTVPAAKTGTEVKAKGSKAPLIAVIAVLVLLLLVGGSYFAYNLFIKSLFDEGPPVADPAEEEVLDGEDKEGTPAEEEAEEAAPPEEEEEEPAEDQEEAEPEEKPGPEPAPEPEPEPTPPAQPEESGTVQNMPYEGGVYSGELKDGLPHGQGEWAHPNGLHYSGQFSGGSITGYGVLTRPDGDVYAGYLRRGIPNGEGRLIKRDGTVDEGYWIDGNLQ